MIANIKSHVSFAPFTDINSSEQTEANPHIDDEEDGLDDAHHQELEGIQLTDDDSKGDEGAGSS